MTHSKGLSQYVALVAGTVLKLCSGTKETVPIESHLGSFIMVNMNSLVQLCHAVGCVVCSYNNPMDCMKGKKVCVGGRGGGWVKPGFYLGDYCSCPV